MKTKNILKFSLLTLAALLAPTFANGQAALSSTTLSAALNLSPGNSQQGVAGTTGTQYVQLASTTGIIAQESMLYVDYELMDVVGVPAPGLVSVRRGAEGTRAQSHIAGATVYFSTGPALLSTVIPTNLSQTSFGFIKFDPAGSCVATQQQVLPQINVNTGARYNCINGLWMVDNGEMAVQPTDCVAYASANGTTPNGYGVVGASNTPVVSQAVTSTGTNTITYVCTVNLPAGLFSPARQAALLDVTFLYGVQTANLGTQAAVAASGTFNGSVVFSKIAMPVAAASETPSTVTPVRADSGSLTVTPVAGSFNVATTTAGAFYSAKFQPGPNTVTTPSGAVITGLPLTADLTTFLFTVTLQCSATTATSTNSPGLIVHYAYVPDYSLNGGVSF